MEKTGRLLGLVGYSVAASVVHAAEDVPVWKLQAQAMVLAQLRDSRSAKFLDVRLVDDVVCGAVNARNGYGGYHGYMPFAVIRSKKVAGPGSVFDATTTSDAVIIADDKRTETAVAVLCTDK